METPENGASEGKASEDETAGDIAPPSVPVAPPPPPPGRPDGDAGVEGRPEFPVESGDVLENGPKRRVRRGLIIGVVAALVVLGGGAYAAVRVFMPSSVNPAERLPDSLIAYAEINLDPSFDQTPKLLDLLETFDVSDEIEGSDDLITRMLEDLELDGVTADDLTSWVGTRAAVGFIGDDIEEPSAILAIASRDDRAAEAGLAAVGESTDEVELDFTVEDGLAVIVVGEGDLSGAAEDVVEAGSEAPLAEHDRYVSDVGWLGGDQLFRAWVDYAAGMDVMAEWMDSMFAEAPEGTVPEGFSASELMLSYEDGYGDYETFVLGIQATSDGVDMRYRATGEDIDQAGNANWRAEMGELRNSQIAATVMFPDLSETSDAYADLLGGITGPRPERLDEYARGQWTYDEAVTDDELSEYEQLLTAWDDGEISEGDAEYDRLVELDGQVYWYGAQRDYDDFIDGGGAEEDWLFLQALTHEEYAEFLKLDDQYYQETLPTDDEQRYFELDQRLFRFGLVSDYDQWTDPATMSQDLYDYLSGGTLTAVLGDVFADQPDIGVEYVVAKGSADRILNLAGWSELTQDLEDELEFDGSTLSYGELTGGEETIADNEWFEVVFDGAPDEASVALFVDVVAMNESAPEPEEELEPVKAVGWVQGSNTEGLLRILID